MPIIKNIETLWRDAYVFKNYLTIKTKIAFMLNLEIHIGVRGEGQGGQVPPPPSKKYQLVGRFLLKSWAIFLSRFCSLIFLIFSFYSSLAGKDIKETLFFKIFQGSIPPDPSRGFRPFSTSRADSCSPPPPKISKPVRLWKSKSLLPQLPSNHAYLTHEIYRGGGHGNLCFLKNLFAIG